MKKLVLLTAIFLGSFAVSQAQSAFQIGIKGGLNFSKLKSDQNEILSSENKTGYQVGIYTRIGNTIHVQPELYLTGKSSRANFVEGNNGSVQGDVSFTSLDLPVLLGTRVGLGPVALRLQAGPLVSFVIDKKIGDAINEIPNFNNYKNNSFALVGGIGVDLGRLRGDLRYEHALDNINKDEPSVVGQRINVWTVGVGLRLF